MITAYVINIKEIMNWVGLLSPLVKDSAQHCQVEGIQGCLWLPPYDSCLAMEHSLDRISVGFCEGRKTGEPGEKPLKHRREPTNSTHI